MCHFLLPVFVCFPAVFLPSASHQLIILLYLRCTDMFLFHLPSREVIFFRLRCVHVGLLERHRHKKKEKLFCILFVWADNMSTAVSSVAQKNWYDENTTHDFGIKFLSIHPVFISVHHVSASHNINSNQNVLGLCELLFWLERKFVWILPTIPTAHEGTVKPELYTQSLSVGLPSCVPAPPPRSSCVLRVPAFLSLLDFGHELIIKTFFTLLSLCVLCLGPLFFDKLLTDRCSENGN